MRRNEQLTAALLLAALTAVGCSKQDTAIEKARSEEHSATAKLTAMADSSSPFKPGGVDAIPVPTGPVAFADGEAAYKSGNYGEATKIFDRYTTEKPDNAWGHYMLGLSASKSGDSEKAEKAFEEALRIDKSHFKSLVNLSRTLMDQKRFDDALGKLALAAEIEPNSAEVQRLLGRAYHGQGKIDDAVSAYRRAISLDNNDAWSMNNLGSLFLEQKRASEALPLLAKAVELRKDVPAFHNNLGMALEHTGRFVAAATAYNGALAADPGYEKAKLNLARVEAVKGNGEEPIDLEATAKLAIPTDETTASR